MQHEGVTVYLKAWQRFVLVVVLVMTTVLVAVASNQILNENVLSWWWCLPALGWSAIATSAALCLTSASSGRAESGAIVSTGGKYVALCAVGVVGVGLMTVFTYMGTSAVASTQHPTCTTGSICLWPERGFGGEMWKWTPGRDAEGLVPERLRDQIGSFQAQAIGCFMDSDSSEMRPIQVGDWSGRYTEKFGQIADVIKANC
ncbi:peptidase inhibitor family I36 protein [Nonomuraea terrae]|uniref:peptidase inhibitor family I36 protein n=1 Tax=Nonomuraea terrae TaxID=2530383 RepID=UPI00378F8632